MILFALGFVFGTWWLQQQATLPGLQGAWILACSLPVFVLMIRCQRRWLKQVGVFLLAALLGFAWAAALVKLRLGDALPPEWQQKSIVLQGVVATLPERNERGERFRFDVEQVLTPGARVPRHISLSWYGEGNNDMAPAARFHAGERWQFTVRLKRPHGTYNPHGFDFEAWALAENIRATGSIKAKSGYKKLQDFVWQPSYMIEAARERLGERIGRALAGKSYAGVIRALVIGDDQAISAQDWQIYARTGTNHLMSISGLHITMLAGLVFALTAFAWRRFPALVMRLPTRKAATIAGLCVALLYALLAGWSVPTQRTVYMLATFALALLYGRGVSIGRALALALLVVTLLDPWAVIAPGFWLSFSAVALLAYVSNGRLKAASWWREAVRGQWAMSIGLLPLLVALFGQASLVSPVANAFAIPVISLLVVPLSILGALFPFDSVLHAAHAILAACMQALMWLSALPIATWHQAAAPGWTLLLAACGVLWLLLPHGFPQRWLGLLLLLPMLLVRPPLPKPGEIYVTVLDVGQGLSVLVQTAQHAMLYDAGPRFNSQSDAGMRIVVPYLRGHGVARLDGLVLSHNDMDHIGGADAVLAQVPVNWLLDSFGYATAVASPKQMRCAAGQHWQWDGVRFEVLSPAFQSYQDPQLSDNNRSCVVKVSSAYGSVLLPGDIEKEVERALLQVNQDALSSDADFSARIASDVLIAPHHGSKTSSTPDFIAAVQPRQVVMTMGYLNRFKHPKAEIVARYEGAGAKIYRSDYHGALEFCFCKQGNLRPLAWRQARVRYWQDENL